MVADAAGKGDQLILEKDWKDEDDFHFVIKFIQNYGRSQTVAFRECKIIKLFSDTYWTERNLESGQELIFQKSAVPNRGRTAVYDGDDLATIQDTLLDGAPVEGGRQ